MLVQSYFVLSEYPFIIFIPCCIIDFIIKFTLIIDSYAEQKYDCGINKMSETLRVLPHQTVFRQANHFITKQNGCFEERLSRVPLTVCFPEYTGIIISNIITMALIKKKRKTTSEACEYVKKRFMEKNIDKERNSTCYFTCAIDTHNVSINFNNIRSGGTLV